MIKSQRYGYTSLVVILLVISGCGSGGGGDSNSSTPQITTKTVEYFPGTMTVSGEGNVTDGLKSGTWVYYNNPDGSLENTPDQFATQHYKRWEKIYAAGVITDWAEFNGESIEPSIREKMEDNGM